VAVNAEDKAILIDAKRYIVIKKTENHAQTLELCRTSR